MKNIVSIIRIALVTSGLFFACAVQALTPPRPSDSAEYVADGSLTERTAAANKIGNHVFSDHLIHQAKVQQNSALYGLPPAEPPLEWQGGLPAAGSPRVPVLLIDFSDYPHDEKITSSSVAEAMFGKGDKSLFPYESLSAYYQRSSYGKLTIRGDVFEWYRAKKERSYYESDCGREELIKEAIGYHASLGRDFKVYDNSGANRIDALYVKWSGPDNGWAKTWWSYKTYFGCDNAYYVQGKLVRNYVWSWVTNNKFDHGVYEPLVDIHETGHLLGLPDYYDYDSLLFPRGGVGGLDMMDGNWGDHNAFSKAMLGWVSPIIIGSGEKYIDFNPSGVASSAVFVMPGFSGNIFSEFFAIQYRKRGEGNDPLNYPADGLLIWHVNAELNSFGSNFKYNNSNSGIGLLKLMEADGLEEITQQLGANAGDYYTSLSRFGQDTNPNSNRYNKYPTGVSVDNIGSAAGVMKARVAVDAVAAKKRTYVKVSNSGKDLPGSASLGSGADDWACTKDVETGLLWEVKTADGGLRDFGNKYTNYYGSSSEQVNSYSNAIGFAKQVNEKFLCGRSNWRIPGKDEFVALGDRSYTPAIDPVYFPNTKADGYWTHLPIPNGSYAAYAVFFGYPFDSWSYSYSSRMLPVRLVSGEELVDLEVSISGGGSGKVLDDSGRVYCTYKDGLFLGKCSVRLTFGMQRLLAEPDPGSVFGKWDNFYCTSDFGNICYLPLYEASKIRVVFDIDGRTRQSISFLPVSKLIIGSSVQLSATATSGLAVRYSTLSSAICSVSGNILTAHRPGTCTVAANQDGNQQYQPASEAIQSIAVVFSGIQRPSAPVITKVVPKAKSVLIHVEQPVSIGGGSILYFTTTCRDNSAFEKSVEHTASDVVIMGLKPGKIFQCDSIAVNAGGAGPASSPISVIPLRNGSLTSLLDLILE